MHLRNSCTRSTSAWNMRHVPSGASGGRGENGLTLSFARKFHETSVTRSLIAGKLRMGSTVTGSARSSSFRRVMHISRGWPLTSAEHDPHFPALQFHRTARSLACCRLNLMDRVEHDHAFRYRRRVVFKPPALSVAAPDSKCCGVSHHFIASITDFSSLGISGIGARDSSMRPSAPFADDDVHFAEGRILVGVILPEVTAAAFAPFDRGAGDRFGHEQQVREIERRVPAGVVFAMAADPDAARPLAQFLEPVERAPASPLRF